MLCANRLGIFVSGRLACIGHPKDITSRFCGFLVSLEILAIHSHMLQVFLQFVLPVVCVFCRSKLF